MTFIFASRKPNIVTTEIYIDNILRPKVTAAVNSLSKEILDEFHLENVILTFLPHCYCGENDYFPKSDTFDDFALLNYIAGNLRSDIKIFTDFYKEIRRIKQNQKYRN